MTTSRTEEPTPQKPLRLWPGVTAVVLQWLARFAVPAVVPEAALYGVLAGLAGGVIVVVWWVFFSRAPWLERLGAVVVMVVALAATPPLLHESIRTGAMGFLFFIYAIPLLSLAFVAWAVASRRLSDGPRRVTMVVTILLACGVWALFRSEGITGGGQAELAWRWSENPEERLLARGGDEPEAPPPPPAAKDTPGEPQVDHETAEPAPSPVAAPPEEGVLPRVGEEAPALPPTPETDTRWPGFRGPARNGVVSGVRIETDWSASPPVELWRRAVGPGWSSFAVEGDRFYTQEQRGEDEVVTCYDAATGEPVWRHRDPVRFWEANAGAGPRATPTLHGGRVYSLGATGILNALDAGDGAVAWSRDAASDTGVEVPYWGFSSSPLVVDDLVIVAAAGQLVAYDRATGDRRWLGPKGGDGYSSPHLATIDGVSQVLLLSGDGATSVAQADGTRLWEHAWPGAGIVQPGLTADGDVLIGTEGGIGRITAALGPGGWTTEERWSSVRLKPYFNDFVVHEGHAFGLDGRRLACIDLEDGERKWKGGRYGNGQLVLLPDQDLLLVLSEEGELALVEADDDELTELARFPAIEGKTWNHPVLVGDVLLVRNDREMAAFRLTVLLNKPDEFVGSDEEAG